MSVTKHARRRSKQRNGFTKGTVEKMSSRAWANGLPRDVIGVPFPSPSASIAQQDRAIAS